MRSGDAFLALLAGLAAAAVALLSAAGAERPSVYVLAVGIAYYASHALARPRLARRAPMAVVSIAVAAAALAAAVEEARRVAGW